MLALDAPARERLTALAEGLARETGPQRALSALSGATVQR
jgi:hypothetical protein